MGIEHKTPMSDIVVYLEKGQEQTLSLLIRNLAYIGEQTVRIARLRGSYTDRTGNLRSSTGYVIVRDGRIIQTGGFEPVNGPEPNPVHPNTEGPKKGIELAKELATQVGQGCISLIVVAGMNYASYVTDKGYDVLDSSYLETKRMIPKMLKQLGLNE